ncbi:MAG: ABC-type antimicrobial peptide transport system permease subunit [Cyclobacteriaceae bacterium]|jgi:ABC-type antimicrobial peptide transport system permease subunit
MWSNYFSTAFRNLLKNRSYVLINIFGLGISLACCITAYIFLAFNIEFDAYLDQESVKNMYRVHMVTSDPDGQETSHVVTPYGLGPRLAKDLPGIESFSRYNHNGGYVRYLDRSFGTGVVFTDSAFFEMFPYRVLSGNLADYSELNTVVISDKSAYKLFADSSAVNEVLTFSFSNNMTIQARVIAVVKELPQNSTLGFEMMMRTEHFQQIYDLPDQEMGDWRDPSILVKFEKSAVPHFIKELSEEYASTRNRLKEDAHVDSFHFEHFLNPISEDDIGWSQINTRISIVPIVVFVSMALMILLIACFNLTNTTIATSSKRMKEVGLRKVVGASRLQIFTQFLIEILIVITLSLIVGLAIANILVDEFTSMWNMPFGLSDISNFNLIIAMIFLLFLTAVLAGFYPAYQHSKLAPITMLSRSKQSHSYKMITRILVGIQFAISVIVLLNGLVFISNTKFQESVDFGFDMDQLLTVFIQSESDYKVMKPYAASNPNISQIAITHHQLGLSSYGFPVYIDTATFNVQHVEIGEGFFEAVGLQLINGRFLDPNRSDDAIGGVIVNRQFLEHVGLPEDALGEIVRVRDERKRIIGTVENHVDNLFRSAEIEPFVYYASKRNEYQMMMVKGEKRNLAKIQDDLEIAWKKEFPDRPFESEFQEELTLGGMRQTNGNLQKIFIFLTVLGSILSACGIYALATLHSEKRTKEIGIRKALGGSISHIISLLSKEFVWILGLASLVGVTLGYYLSTGMLDEIYAYHVSIKWWVMLLSGLIIFSVGLVTTWSIIYRAAKANPIESLRDE